ncbi:T9SS C-terminal target domain-containing protein [Sphingobacteriales bacterium UPWRP_1]|nr:hypothetical protein B6N25_14665 [Sphingobacteriales bacterium TSM_CSS]PSJ78942.1 T9SS C-terminal target domain-containing protein [Sphingobacteriales bacterium UPWRP_1]
MKHFLPLFSRPICFLFACCITSLLNLSSLQAQQVCPDGEVEVRVELIPDGWAASETSWEVLNLAGEQVLSGTNDGGSFCTPTANACFTFNIYDTYGDGLVDGGGYTVYFNDTEVTSGGNFGFFASMDFGICPPGYSCHFPISAYPDVEYTATPPNTWYLFVPDTSGHFTISTCNTEAPCATGIWMYDYCDNLHWAGNMEASIYYSTSGCEPHASLLANLMKNEVYYLRIGDVDGSCATNPITWSITFDGPISGCTDPTACNYDPVATLPDPDACLYPGDPACPNGPDLIVVQSEIASSMYVDHMDNSDACYIAEGCMDGYGERDLLRFTTHIKNIGNQDYYIGYPPASPSEANLQWEWDPCHGHWHYEGYAEYLLYDSLGQQIPIGFKNGFCVMDLECSGGGVAKFNCGNQGITAGCGDIYSSGLACQWIDITTMPAGTYTLVVRVNWDQTPDALGRIELNQYNNWAQVCISINRDADGNLINVTQVEDCDPYTDCLGEIYGSATIDCEGICNGQKIIGDLDADGTYHTNDVLTYMTGILNGELTTGTSCNDLNNDGLINVVDADLLLACILQGNGTHTHPGGGTSHNHCGFPQAQVINPNGLVSLTLDNINPAGSYADVYIKSPMQYILGYQLQISGLQVLGVAPILEDPNYTADISFNPTGEILGISVTESKVDRYLEFMPFLRIFYSATTADEVCLSVTAMVNDNYEETLFEVVNPCLPAYTFTGISGANAVSSNAVTISPNPFSKTTTLHFANPQQQPYTLQITNTSGNVVKTYNNITTGNLRIDMSQLPAGIYLYRLTGSNAVYTGKLVAE